MSVDIPPDANSTPYLLSRLRLAYQSLLLKCPNNLLHRLFHLQLPIPHHHLRMLRLLIRRADPRKILDLPRPRLLIQPFGIARFGNFERDMDVDFYKGDLAVFMKFAGKRAVGSVGGDKGR